MSDPVSRPARRSDALSRHRIVQAAIELLDASGESALTVRALTAHLETGRGAIYHHVAGKEELLAEATDRIIGAVFSSPAHGSDARQAVRVWALGIVDALAEHPWVGAQLGRDPLQPAVRRIWSGFAAQLEKLGVTGASRSNAGAALVNYILGAAAQYSAGTHHLPDSTDRKEYLEAVAAELLRTDSDPLTHETAKALVDHDDREQFLAGIDIFLAGIVGLNAANDPSPAHT